MGYIRVPSIVLLFFAASIYAVLGAKIPSDWKLCKRTPDINKCLSEAMPLVVRKLGSVGNPQLKIGSVDPLEVPSMTIGAGTGPVNVVQYFKNCKIYGIAASTVTNVAEDLDHYNLKFETATPYINVVADYTLNGRVLILPVQGEGKCNLTLTNARSTHNLIGEQFSKNGLNYFRVKEYKLTLDIDRIHFQFDNLFNGNKELGDNLNAVLNDNWKDVFDDIKSGYEESFGLIFKNVANQVLTNFPLDVLFPKDT